MVKVRVSRTLGALFEFVSNLRAILVAGENFNSNFLRVTSNNSSKENGGYLDFNAKRNS